jgi:hypothetical protein
MGFNPTIIQARSDLLLAAQSTGTTAGLLTDYAAACRGLGKNATTTGTSDTVPVADYTLGTGTSSCSGLSIFASGTPDLVAVGSHLNYVLIVVNGSPVPGAMGTTALNTQVAISLPNGVTNVTATTSQGNCGPPSGSSLKCTVGSVAYGSRIEIDLRVVPRTPGTISMAATVSGNVGGSNSGQPDAQVETTVCVSDMVFSNSFEPTTPNDSCS